MATSKDPLAGDLSWSKASTWYGCGNKFALSYIERAPKIPMGFFIGPIAVHEAIEFAEKSDAWQEPGAANRGGLLGVVFDDKFSDEKAKQEARSDWPIQWTGRKSAQWPEGENEDWWRANGPDLLRNYVAQRRADEAEGVHVLIDERGEACAEMTVRAILPSGRPLTTRIDSLMVDPDGVLRVRDYKAGKPGGGEAMQGLIYSWATHETLGHPYGLAEFCYVRATDPAKRCGSIEVAPLVGQVDRFFADFEKGVEAGSFPLVRSNFCGTCAVRRSCEWGKTIDGEEE